MNRMQMLRKILTTYQIFPDFEQISSVNYRKKIFDWKLPNFYRLNILD